MKDRVPVDGFLVNISAFADEELECFELSAHGRDAERALTDAVRRVYVGSGAQQVLHDLDMTVERGAA